MPINSQPRLCHGCLCYTYLYMSKRILVILGHPDSQSDTYSGQVADMYQQVAAESGHEVKRVNIADLHFDPILHKGYREIQPLEPDLLAMQEEIKLADHIVVVYPNWWVTMPALLKGLFDRIWLPGFAFNFNKENGKVEQHLKGKTARVFVLSGSHSHFKTWWKFGDFTNEIQHGILGFAGVQTSVSVFGPCEKVNSVCKEKWLAEVEKLAKKGR